MPATKSNEIEHADHLSDAEAASTDVEHADHYDEAEVPAPPVTQPEQLAPAAPKAGRLGHMATPGPATGLPAAAPVPVVPHNIAPNRA